MDNKLKIREICGDYALDIIAFIATADERTFYCPIGDLKNCIYKE